MSVSSVQHQENIMPAYAGMTRGRRSWQCMYEVDI